MEIVTEIHVYILKGSKSGEFRQYTFSLLESCKLLHFLSYKSPALHDLLISEYNCHGCKGENRKNGGRYWGVGKGGEGRKCRRE